MKITQDIWKVHQSGKYDYFTAKEEMLRKLQIPNNV